MQKVFKSSLFSQNDDWVSKSNPKTCFELCCLEAISVQLFLTPLVSEKQKNLSYKPFRLSDTNQN